MKKRVITTADDFGSCKYIDRGIRKGIEEGVVSSVAAFVNFKPRTRNQPGGAYEGSIPALQKLRQDFPNIPVGLHLTIHAGEPVSDPKAIKKLVRRRTTSNEFEFKDITKFRPRDFRGGDRLAQLDLEVQNQLDMFRKHLGPPDSVSCHFGIVFQFIRILKRITARNQFRRVQVRNPLLAWQTPAQRKDPNQSAITALQNEFKGSSRMKAEGLDIGLKWMEDLFTIGTSLTSVTNKKSRIECLQKQKLLFPEFTYGYLYKRKDDYKGLQYLVDQMPNFIPLLYKKRGRTIPAHEIVCHLGSGALPASAPNGVGFDYFPGRNLELKRLLKDKDVLQGNKVKLISFKDLGSIA